MICQTQFSGSKMAADLQEPIRKQTDESVDLEELLKEATVARALQEARKKISDLYGERLQLLALYGSWARGEANVHSDIDLLVVLDGETPPGQEIDRMIDVITDINLRYNVLLAVVPVSTEDYRTTNSPLLLNVRREGILL
jgi:uncharacterized protein